MTQGPQLVMRKVNKQIHDTKKHWLEHLLRVTLEKKTAKQILYLELLCFWTFVHRPEFQILENSTFRKLDLFLSSGEGRETPTLLRPL
jgi:hypothetical protein